MKINLKLKDWNLRHKIILHIAVIGILSAALLTYLYMSTQNKIINTFSLEKAELVGSMIEYGVAHRMQEGKPNDVGIALQHMVESNKIKSLRIIDLKGKILESSDIDEVGNYIPESRIQKVHELYSGVDQDNIPQTNHISTNQSLYTIQNKKECYTCHSSNKKIIALLEMDLEETPIATFIYKTQFNAVIISFLALAALIFITLRLFEKIINRPLSQLKDQMRLVQGGNLSVQLKPLKNDDIGDLTQSFNIMVARRNRGASQPGNRTSRTFSLHGRVSCRFGTRDQKSNRRNKRCPGNHQSKDRSIRPKKRNFYGSSSSDRQNL
jgi:methyl-accepting chemotaxis protein